ncbi:iron-hydroxamate ABC transporter substrate-binding protein [Paenibacillus daejeonensis]|uniref:iron-hydroxamate ABC transporter substrate-binding protein n=1 Tax=Paenibacillus daejeonensis TaxID=135193 RepID=UPI00036CC7F0|nr:iron-hydroxamate ABC transporter substrate-binding protein [Paenibacillus daejeonensis]
MKKVVYFAGLFLLIMLLAACGSNTNNEESVPAAPNTGSGTEAPDTNEEAATEGDTITYQSETGPVEIPANPQRIVALTNAPNVLSLEGHVVGVDQWTQANPLFTERLEGVKVVSEADFEEILDLDPDLIIAGSHMETIAELEKIAPTVVYTWGKLDYLEQQLEIGKLLNKEQETQEWIDDFTARAAAVGEEVKGEFGEDVSVSVFETDSKNFSVFGANWARGTEILYQAMGLSMPEKARTDTLDVGYYNLSLEVIPDYAGDFIILSRPAASETSYMDTEVWKSIPAVQNDRVITIDLEASTYSDPISLETMLGTFQEGMLGSQ